MKNKNITLAQCRMIWAIMTKLNCNKNTAVYKIYGSYDMFESGCPLCSYARTAHNMLDCDNCIRWGKDEPYKYACQVIFGSAYNIWERNNTSENAKAVLATIDRAIKLLDETGNWR